MSAPTPTEPPVITRFAPSPTGFLHIGGARTALFNWLFARHTGGAFRLRIEDTDRARSTPEAIEAILEGLTWLGLAWDGEVVYQSARASRHCEVADALLAAGQAYRCYASPEDLETMRAEAKAAGRPARYDGRWRDRDPSEAPADTNPTIRLKAPLDRPTIVRDVVQGDVTFAADALDDMVLVRSDGTPTYMLAVVVDDHDMGVTHVLRGDDHLINAARQSLILEALAWDRPTYAHIPLIHGPDGAKLSKRHGALGIEAYREMGYLPAGLRNYLVRLGWSHGDDELFSDAEAIAWFDLGGLNKAPARLDLEKLAHVNAHHLRSLTTGQLTDLLFAEISRSGSNPDEWPDLCDQIARLAPNLQERSKTTPELLENTKFLMQKRPLIIAPKMQKHLSEETRTLIKDLMEEFSRLREWDRDPLDDALAAFCSERDLKVGKIAPALRAALTGGLPAPSIADVLYGLGRDEALARLTDQAA